jgi:hypothetical protein
MLYGPRVMSSISDTLRTLIIQSPDTTDVTHTHVYGVYYIFRLLRLLIRRATGVSVHDDASCTCRSNLRLHPVLFEFCALPTPKTKSFDIKYCAEPFVIDYN